MPEQVQIIIDGVPVQVEQGTNLAAALMKLNLPFRMSTTGEVRAPLCGMGSCFECRVTVDGIAHTRACMIPCRPGMTVTTRG